MTDEEKARAEAATPPLLADVPIREGLYRVIYVEPYGSLEVGFYMVYAWMPEQGLWAQELGYPVKMHQRVQESLQ